MKKNYILYLIYIKINLKKMKVNFFNKIIKNINYSYIFMFYLQ